MRIHDRLANDNTCSVNVMKILFATDGSRFSDVVLRMIIARPWPPDTEVRALSVVHPLPFVPDPTFIGIGLHYQSLEQEQKRAARAIAVAARELGARAAHLRFTSGTADGAPARQIVDEAKRWGADLIAIGSRGHGVAAGLVLGSITNAVVLHAHCSVEVVREHAAGAEEV
jgi:nucleotide-binding universal stress UspA family protein